ncbi:MAG: hypothetical protein JW995_15660 [Melioribacteraceae bacterium]|nr:hypothetical protein [Melioribacteraceae bacterium]
MKGRLNFKIAEQYSKEAIKLAHKNECTKFLINHTETLLSGTIDKIHTEGEELQQFGFKSTDQIAVILPNLGEDSNLVEPVNKNIRWSELKYFNSANIQEAFKWLI